MFYTGKSPEVGLVEKSTRTFIGGKSCVCQPYAESVALSDNMDNNTDQCMCRVIIF